MFKSVIAVAVVLAVFGSSLQVDNTYCSLNLEKNECVSQTTNGNCCWLTFVHKNGYGRAIDGCFDYRFIVNSLKFITNPKNFDTMTDSDVCKQLGMECTSITKANFLTWFNKAPQYADTTLITSVTASECHP